MITNLIALGIAVNRSYNLVKKEDKNIFMKIFYVLFNLWSAYYYPILYSLITLFIMFYVEKKEGRTITVDNYEFREIMSKSLQEKISELKGDLNKIYNAIKNNETIIKFSKVTDQKIKAFQENKFLIDSWNKINNQFEKYKMELSKITK